MFWYMSHDETMKKLETKKRIAEMKFEERKLKLEILKLYFPIKLKIKFNKLIVLISILSVISYVTAAILIQKYTLSEVSPTLTTCVFAFFGTELLSLAGIKVMDSKFSSENNYMNENDYNIT